MEDLDFLPLLGVFREGPPPEVNDIVKIVQIEFGIALPASLLRLWSVSEDMAVVYCENALSHSDEGYQLYSLDSSDENFVISQINLFLDREHQIYPIGCTASGDRLCLSYRTGDDPAVVYYSTGLSYDFPNALQLLARSFDEFVLRASSDFDAATITTPCPMEQSQILGFDHA